MCKSAVMSVCICVCTIDRVYRSVLPLKLAEVNTTFKSKNIKLKFQSTTSVFYLLKEIFWGEHYTDNVYICTLIIKFVTVNLYYKLNSIL